MGSARCSHSVQFYGSDDRFLVKSVCGYFAEGLTRGEKVLCIATQEHRDMFVRQLRANGYQLPEDKHEGTERMVFADARQAIPCFMRKGMPDPALFADLVKPLIDQMGSSGGSMKGRAYGELVGLLWENGHPAAALRVEQLWNELLGTAGIDLLCGYPIDIFSERFHSPESRAILAEHSEFISSVEQDEIRAAVECSTQEVLGKTLAELTLGGMSQSGFVPWLPSGEAAILTLRANLPHRAAEVLAIARQRYGAERRFRSIIENSPDGIALLDADCKIVYASPSMEKILGYTPAESYGRNFLNFVHPDNLSLLRSHFYATLKTGDSPASLQFLFRHQDGRWVSLEGTLSNRLDDTYIQAMVFNFRDISRHKRAEDALRTSERRWKQSERYLAALLDSLPEGVAVLDRDGAVLQMNRAGLEMVEADTPQHIDGKSFVSLIGPSSQQAFLALNESVFAGGEGGILEFPITGLKGSRRTLETRAATLRDEEDQVVGAIFAIRDITQRKLLEDERKLLEKKMRETAKLESLGLLAGGIAHDFNNLLTGILCSATMLQAEVSTQSVLYPAIDTIARAGERASHLTRQMLDYSGRAHFVVEPLNLARHAREILDLLGVSIAKHVHLVDDLEETGSTIEADAGQIQQVIMNLILNAAEATTSEGVVSVAVRPVRLEAPKATVTAELTPGDYVELEVRDQGIGMDDETKRKIFDPFFTTKVTGRGLGLASVLGILKSHKAGLEVDSALQCGSVFRVYFPLASRYTPPVQSVPPAPKATGGTILMVDDDDVLLRVGKLALESLRFKVLLARNGDQAIEQFERAHAELALVILDMTMPGLTVEETLHKLKAINSLVPIVGSSGYTADEAYGRFGSGIAGFLQKPYAIQRLSEVVLSTALCPELQA